MPTNTSATTPTTTQATTRADTPSRRGRPRAGEREERERRIVEAALEELIEHGYEKVTMLAVARRAGASKETLYSWFGSKEGLFSALIEANADQSAERIATALDSDDDPVAVLTAYAVGLLTLLTSPGSLALNQAAMSSPTLAETLLASGRHRVGPIVERYLAHLGEAGNLRIEDPAEAFELLYGLVVRDTQIRALLGESAPTARSIQERADRAVADFVRLASPSG
ncbi:MAG: TetR/AcrR family transcriptional regulator [Actinomycetota bacterium]